MTWARIDDQLHGHRKIKRAWKIARGALGLHLMALSYCAAHLTDGLVDEEFVEEKLPTKGEREKLAGALVTAGLWTVVDGGWQINDFLEYNPSKAEVQERRRKEADRKAAARAAKAEQRPNVVPLGRAADSRWDADGSPLYPDPARPDPARGYSNG